MLARIRYLTRPIVTGTCLVLLCSCAVGPDFVQPDAPKINSYGVPDAGDQSGIAAQKIEPGANVPADWWTLFQSAQLNSMVQESITHNATLEAAIATLRQSLHNVQAGDGVFFPQIDAGLSGLRARSAPIQEGLQTPSSIYTVAMLSGSISYTLDLFGGERRAVEGLNAQSDYQRYAYTAAYVTLTANVVDAGIARAAYAAQIRATEQLIALQQQQLLATRAQIQAGTSSYSAELSIRSLIAANQATLAPLKQQISQTENLLATLEGKFRVEADLPAIDLDALVLPASLPLSLASGLVRQRPDILQSEAQLHVASANIGVATAAMFPSISLTGNVGQAGTSLGNLSGENGRFWSVGPSVSIPIFRGGTLWYGRKAALDAYQAAQANYRQTVLTAFAQVATSLQALEHDAEAYQAQTEAKQDAGEALQLTQTNYKAGTSSYLDVLSADVLYHQANIAWFQSVAQRHQDTVALFVALGGGWWNADETQR
jgi:NodT family efflux transporter outer membrane factor (OMF) lipoprotein